MAESDRRKILESLRPEMTVRTPIGFWSGSDMERLKAAFKVRFDEDLPRTETLCAVASEGARIFAERAGMATDTARTGKET